MDFNDVRKVVDKHVELIEIGKTGFAEANDRASSFLVVTAILTDYLKEVDDDLARIITLRDAHYAQINGQLSGGEDEKFKLKPTEKKKLILADKDYSSNRQQVEELQSLQNWIKGYVKIFENAHVHYRQMAREGD